ncbi:MAG TPA: PilN domain-containing protein [Polyangiales bacterium]|nr:PilN domain-containing protein [Polyangiales bacterium]
MRISINLASRPFVELRPLFLRLRLLMVLLAAAAIGLGVWAHFLQKRLVHAAAQMDVLRNETIATQHERLQNEARMRQPANAAVLDRAHFLNALFLQKSFSWTAVMMDLENVLPTGVQVTSIEPQVTKTGDVIIRLRVSGERDRAVQLVRNLEHSRRFLQPRLSDEASQAKTAGNPGGFRQPQVNIPAAPAGVEFDIIANYNPLPPGETYTSAKQSRAASPRGAGR